MYIYIYYHFILIMVSLNAEYSLKANRTLCVKILRNRIRFI